MCVHIFSCLEWTGHVKECGEIKPVWHAYEDIPFHSMWADNKFWLPQVLEGSRVRGYFLYSDLDHIQDHHLEIL